jgi:hypothetical protein
MLRVGWSLPLGNLTWLSNNLYKIWRERKATNWIGVRLYAATAARDS